MYYLNEKGERVYTLKVREPRRPPPTALRHPVASEETLDAEAAIRLTRLRLSPLATTENCPRRFPHAVGAPSSLQPRR